MTFGKAIDALKAGKHVARLGWNVKRTYLFLITLWTYNAKSDKRPNLPFIAMKTADDCIVPWLASQTDMLSDDWTLVS